MPPVRSSSRPPRCLRPLPPSFFAGARGIDVLIASALALLGVWFLGDHARWAAWSDGFVGSRA